MATVALDQYLASIINTNRTNSSEIFIKSGNAKFNLFELYLESNNPVRHQYLDPLSTILYVVRGNVIIKSKNKQFNMDAGNELLITNNHEYEVQKRSSDAVLVKFKFNSTFNFFKLIEKYPKNDQEKVTIKQVVTYLKQEKILWLKNNSITRASQVMLSIINDYLNHDLFATELISTEFDIMMILSIRNHKIATASDQEKVKFNQSSLNRYIDAHFIDINLSMAAKYFGFNSNYFSNMVKQKTGKSFMAHVDDRRMQEAKILLAKPDMSLKDIISKVGYSSKSFFYKKFNQYYGETPAAMRERLFREVHINLK